MPSVPVAILAAVLVNILYSLVPAGRLRERAKLVVTWPSSGSPWCLGSTWRRRVSGMP